LEHTKDFSFTARPLTCVREFGAYVAWYAMICKVIRLTGLFMCFFSKSYQTVKLLVWDRDGFVVYMKRLERGRFESLTKIEGDLKYSIGYQHLVMLLSGISLVGVKQKLRYNLNQTAIGA
jgi:transposase